MIVVKPKGVIYRLRGTRNCPYKADVLSSNLSLPTFHKPSFTDGVLYFYATNLIKAAILTHSLS